MFDFIVKWIMVAYLYIVVQFLGFLNHPEYLALLLLVSLIISFAVKRLLFKDMRFRYGGIVVYFIIACIGSYVGDYLLNKIGGLVFSDFNVLGGIIGSLAFSYIWGKLTAKKEVSDVRHWEWLDSYAKKR